MPVESTLPEEIAERLLRVREARSLIWSIAARLVLYAVVIIASYVFIHNLRGFEGMLTWSAFVGTASIASLVLARRQERLRLVGGAGLAFDLGFLVLLPYLWYLAFGAADLPRSYFLEERLEIASMFLIVINALALRPWYPAIMTGVAVLWNLAVYLYMLRDPRVVLTVDTLRGFALEQVSVREMVLPLVTITIIGFFLTFLARSARRTIEDVVALEAKNLRMVKEQAELVMDVKMTGLATMVAGVAHEINTPLGVTLSSVGNLESCAHKMEDVLGENRKLRPVLDAHKENTGTIRKAGQRISGVVHSLRNFARLDEAEVQKADVRVGLDSTLALALPENAGHVEVVKEYKDVPLIYCRPKELNQVFLTIITNALEAMEGKGTLGIRVGGDSQHVDIRIADSGKGIPADRLQSLFDLHFAASKGRIAMGLGLPTAKKIIDRAGGTILAESEVGKGTTFVISLPVSGL